MADESAVSHLWYIGVIVVALGSLAGAGGGTSPREEERERKGCHRARPERKNRHSTCCFRCVCMQQERFIDGKLGDHRVTFATLRNRNSPSWRSFV